MAHVLRPLFQWRRWRHSLLARHSPSALAGANLPSFAFFSVSERAIHSRSCAIKLRDVPVPSEVNESDGESSDGGGAKKSRNERKRDARRAVQWGMELARFTPPQIKRILRVASLEQEVLDALMLVKRLGQDDVREGKRRQFNYIGKFLREVEPELMDSLIQATKDGDQSMFKKLAGPETLDTVDEIEAKEEIVEDSEEDPMNVAIVTRWYEGLINKNISITNEIYSLQGVEFDRQELRKLVRKVHSTLENETSLEDTGKPDSTAINAIRSLTRFLRSLAKELPDEWAINE